MKGCTSRSTFLRTVMFLMILSGISTIPLFSQDAGNPNGEAIAREADNMPSPSSTHALIRLELVDSKGKVSTRVIEQWSADNAEKNTDSVIVFHEPASVKNTRFLSKENTGRDDDQWIYLPALRRVRRIAASEGSSSFMGTEFSYDDLSSIKIDKYTHSFVKEEQAQGYLCQVVQAIPKDPSTSQYAKTLSWIVKDPKIRAIVKIQMFNSAGTQIKEYTVNKLKKIEGYWIPTSVTMKNLENGRSTNLIMLRLELDKTINPRRFTPRFLQTGRTN